MRAKVTPRFGGPEPGPGEVLVRVVAGTNPIDARFREAGGTLGLESPLVLGSDVSGVVEKVGPGARPTKPS